MIMKMYSIKNNFFKRVGKAVLLLCICFSFSSCVLIVLGIEKMKEKKEEKKLAKEKARFTPRKVSGLLVTCPEPGFVTYGSKRILNLKVTLTDSLGKKYPYYPEKDGVVKWEDFDITADGAAINQNTLSVSDKISQCPSGKVKIHAVYKLKAGIDTTFTLDLFANKSSWTGFGGKPGDHGHTGAHGFTGSSGDTQCTDGQQGGDAGDGGDGQDGPDVTVYIKKTQQKQMNKDVVIVKCVNESTGEIKFSYLDLSSAASLTVYASGGHGGYGGTGGMGRDGGKVQKGGTIISKCSGGVGGNGGNGGSGGNGGTLKVFVDPSVNIANVNIKFDNSGGHAGYPGSGGSGGYHGGNNGSGSKKASDGHQGHAGRSGRSGPKPEIVTKPLEDSIFN
ncbi:MAG: hypothetical protein K0S32_97 [Bacteroidetes bacterium]|jgi:hypothetical protein|nr:hypothetical protein [Bacteroidota bacterium]